MLLKFNFRDVCFLAGNCACSNEDENKNKNEKDDMIMKKLDEAKHIALNQEQQANNNPNQGVLGSILAHLRTILKSLLSAILTGYLSIVASLPEGLAGALEGLSANGLIGLLSGLARSLNELFRKTSGKSIISGLTTGEQNRWNFISFVRMNDWKFPC